MLGISLCVCVWVFVCWEGALPSRSQPFLVSLINIITTNLTVPQSYNVPPYTFPYSGSSRREVRMNTMQHGTVPGVAVKLEDGAGVIVPKVKVLRSRKRRVKTEQT